MSCLFCRIFNREIPVNLVYENEKVIGFKDIAPQAKEHYLFIHKNHSNHVNELGQNDLVDVFHAIKLFTESTELKKTGFRVVTNSGSDAGQTVFHTHFHVLGGEALRGFGAR